MTMANAATDSQVFAISRTFNAPRERVWAAHASAEALSQWWGPKGCAIRVIKLDFRPGGIFHYAMSFQPGAPEMFGRFIYREVLTPSRLVYVSSFSDAEGGVTRAPFPQLDGKFPLEVLNTMTFTEAGGKTTIDLRGGPINATDDERRMFAGMHDSMRGGFSGTFDQLDQFLAKG
jgi:uncharacterized protein YndB with AHSA1/START domain